MLASLLHLLLLVSSCVSAQWSTTVRPLGVQTAGTNASSATTLDDGATIATALNATPPTFEELVATGLFNLRLLFPYTELKLIAASPLNNAAYASRMRDFRHVILLGRDTQSGRYLRMDNKRGRNSWNAIGELHNLPTHMREKPSFLYQPFPVNFEAAYRLARPEGPIERPFADIHLSAQVFPEVPNLGVAYFFVDADYNGGVAVGAVNGEVHQIQFQGGDEVGISLDTTLERNASTMYDEISTT